MIDRKVLVQSDSFHEDLLFGSEATQSRVRSHVLVILVRILETYRGFE